MITALEKVVALEVRAVERGMERGGGVNGRGRGRGKVGVKMSELEGLRANVYVQAGRMPRQAHTQAGRPHPQSHQSYLCESEPLLGEVFVEVELGRFGVPGCERMQGWGGISRRAKGHLIQGRRRWLAHGGGEGGRGQLGERALELTARVWAGWVGWAGLAGCG